MGRLISSAKGLFTCEIEVHGPVLEAAIEQENAEEVFHGAIVLGLAALAQDKPWPRRLIDWMSRFMIDMKEQLMREELH